mmetsp:Transcript_22744/g.33009  ORF Transcript_22744/g.33009 Transcript_22744/m.33009 type:complete len:214 (-) Transcript_22744:1321-1962(-)
MLAVHNLARDAPLLLVHHALEVPLPLGRHVFGGNFVGAELENGHGRVAVGVVHHGEAHGLVVQVPRCVGLEHQAAGIVQIEQARVFAVAHLQKHLILLLEIPCAQAELPLLVDDVLQPDFVVLQGPLLPGAAVAAPQRALEVFDDVGSPAFVFLISGSGGGVNIHSSGLYVSRYMTSVEVLRLEYHIREVFPGENRRIANVADMVRPSLKVEQ